MNCTAQDKEGKVWIWAPTQVPQMAVAIAARVAGWHWKTSISPSRCWAAGLAAGWRWIAWRRPCGSLECGGRPVQLIWSREEDTTHDFYRPMQVARLSAAVDPDGQISLAIKSAGDAITPRWLERNLPALAGPVDTPDKSAAEGLFDLPYGFASQKMSHVATRSGVPVGYWRSVGHSQNAFFSESFMDELAKDAKQDPLAFRRSLLGDAPRHLAVLDLAATKAGWGRPCLPAGRAALPCMNRSVPSWRRWWRCRC
jgi:isoquinoline 1-oxidoreductase beta subunit